MNFLFESFMIIFTSLVGVIALSNKKYRFAFVLLGSLCIAQFLSFHGLQVWHSVTMIFFIAVCVVGFKKGKFYTLEVENNELNYAVAFLYWIRMLANTMAVGGLFNAELIWVLSTIILLSLQNILIFGGCLSGGSKRIDTFIASVRHRINNGVF